MWEGRLRIRYADDTGFHGVTWYVGHDEGYWIENPAGKGPDVFIARTRVLAWQGAPGAIPREVNNPYPVHRADFQYPTMEGGRNEQKATGTVVSMQWAGPLARHVAE